MGRSFISSDQLQLAVDSSQPLLSADSYSLLTVSRLRPLARRRLSTRRPFLLLIRTRNPWVRLRWRLLGWNVRFPFIMIPAEAPATRASTRNRTVNGNERVPEVSIGVVCATVGVLPAPYLRPSRQHAYLVRYQSFPHLWKKLWKIGGIQQSIGLVGRIIGNFDRRKPRGLTRTGLSAGCRAEGC